MKKLMQIKRAIWISVVLASIVVYGGIANSTKQRDKKDTGLNTKPVATDAITVSGTVTGSLEGRVDVGNRKVIVTKNTRIFRTGKGVLEYGTFVVDTPVYVVCEKKQRAMFAQLIIVSDRKPAEGSKGEAGILDPELPR